MFELILFIGLLVNCECIRIPVQSSRDWVNKLMTNQFKEDEQIKKLSETCEEKKTQLMTLQQTAHNFLTDKSKDEKSADEVLAKIKWLTEEIENLQDQIVKRTEFLSKQEDTLDNEAQKTNTMGKQSLQDVWKKTTEEKDSQRTTAATNLLDELNSLGRVPDKPLIPITQLKEGEQFEVERFSLANGRYGRFVIAHMKDYKVGLPKRFLEMFDDDVKISMINSKQWYLVYNGKKNKFADVQLKEKKG